MITGHCVPGITLSPGDANLLHIALVLKPFHCNPGLFEARDAKKRVTQHVENQGNCF